MPIVYLLTNTANDKRYVGKTVRTLDVRWQGHLGSARRGDTDMLVCRAIHKHGPEAFTRRVLEECDEAALPGREAHWVRELATHVSQGGYNLTFGGDGGLPGYTFSEESREKIRQKALGRKHSEESKAKMRAAKLGKKQSVEHVEKRAVANSGKKRTDEQRTRISKGLKGHAVSDETRVKIGIASSQRVVSEETKRKLSQCAAERRLAKELSVDVEHPQMERK